MSRQEWIRSQRSEYQLFSKPLTIPFLWGVEEPGERGEKIGVCRLQHYVVVECKREGWNSCEVGGAASWVTCWTGSWIETWIHAPFWPKAGNDWVNFEGIFIKSWGSMISIQLILDYSFKKDFSISVEHFCLAPSILFSFSSYHLSFKQFSFLNPSSATLIQPHIHIERFHAWTFPFGFGLQRTASVLSQWRSQEYSLLFLLGVA